MAVHTPFAHNLNYRYYVYALFCRDSGGKGYVKFGHSRRIDLRLSQIRTSCPLPIKRVALIEVRTEDRQKRVEKALHQHFKGRKIQGEWFGFDFSSATDKEAFNQGCKEVFSRHLSVNDDQYWGQIDCRVLDTIAEERRKNFMSLPERYKRRARQIAERNKAVTCR